MQDLTFVAAHHLIILEIVVKRGAAGNQRVRILTYCNRPLRQWAALALPLPSSEMA